MNIKLMHQDNASRFSCSVSGEESKTCRTVDQSTPHPSRYYTRWRGKANAFAIDAEL